MLGDNDCKLLSQVLFAEQVCREIGSLRPLRDMARDDQCWEDLQIFGIKVEESSPGGLVTSKVCLSLLFDILCCLLSCHSSDSEESNGYCSLPVALLRIWLI